MTTVSTPRKIATTATANATLAKGSLTPVDATAAARTMTLPTDAVAGVELSVEKVDASANTVTVSGTLRGTAASTIVLTTQYEARTFLSEGAGSWRPTSDHRTAAALSSAYVERSFVGKQAQDALDAKALRRFRTALADRNTNPCDMLHIGDSITWGYKSGSLAARWPAVFRDTLRSRFPNAPGVTGGFGWTSTRQTFAPVTPSDAFVTTVGGTQASSNWGLDRNAQVLSAANNSITWTFTGTGFDIWYTTFSAGGTFSYAVDGGAATNVSTTNASLVYANRNQAIRGLTAGSHTVTVTFVSGGSCYITGGFIYNGDETKGLRSWVTAWPSTRTDYWTGATDFNAGWALVQPDLVTIELGPNDYASATPNSVPTYKANMLTLISRVKAQVSGYVPSFVLIPVWPLTPNGTTLGTWQAYVDAQYEIAAADTDGAVCILDMQARTSSTAGTTIGGLLDVDNTHPNAVGDRYIAETLAHFVAPR